MAGITGNDYRFQQSYTPQTTLIWVNGEDGAKNYPVARGNTVLLLDSQDSKFYLKSMDLTGFVSIRKFRFEELVDAIKPDGNLEQVDEISQLNNALDSTANIVGDLQKMVEKFQNETVEEMRNVKDQLAKLESKLEWKHKIKKEGKVNE